jgi:hypothetical protein
MTRAGPAKAVGHDHAAGRLRKAVAFHAVARRALADLSNIGDADVATANAILGAIAYADALTAATLGLVNQQDHSAAARLLRAALGKQLPDAQEKRLGRLLGRKDEVSYGARPGRTDDARRLLQELDLFAAWAIETLASQGVRLTDAALDAEPSLPGEPTTVPDPP